MINGYVFGNLEWISEVEFDNELVVYERDGFPVEGEAVGVGVGTGNQVQTEGRGV